MNIIGEEITVIDSSDRTKIGLSGTVMLETQNTFVLRTSKCKKIVEKKNTVIKLGKETVDCTLLLGKLERRLVRN